MVSNTHNEFKNMNLQLQSDNRI